MDFEAQVCVLESWAGI